jgi:hypothetical protein
MSEVTISGDRIAWPDGPDPLIREAAAGAPATNLCRAAFDATWDRRATALRAHESLLFRQASGRVAGCPSRRTGPRT